MARLPDAVLFACSENAIRSPMAAALLDHLLGHRVFVESAGVRAGGSDAFAVAAMDELGIDIGAHRAKTFDDLEDGSFDLVITLSPEAHHAAMELTRTMACDVEYWPTFDPSIQEGSRDERLTAYRQVRDDLLARIRRRFPQDMRSGG